MPAVTRPFFANDVVLVFRHGSSLSNEWDTGFRFTEYVIV